MKNGEILYSRSKGPQAPRWVHRGNAPLPRVGGMTIADRGNGAVGKPRAGIAIAVRV
jgi:hypothetical protein